MELTELSLPLSLEKIEILQSEVKGFGFWGEGAWGSYDMYIIAGFRYIMHKI